MKAARFLTLDGRTLTELKPIGRIRQRRSWLPAALLALVLVLMMAALPPRLADICSQDASLACGP